MSFYNICVKYISNKLHLKVGSKLFYLSPKTMSSKIFDDSDPKTVEVKKELTDIKDKEYYSAYNQSELGWVYAKKPHKYLCIEGKAYIWCSCGRSHKQPFCDGTHRNKHLRINLKPIRWDCKQTKEYWFCNCKQTRHRPFCDGSHNSEKVQTGQSTIRDVNSPPFINETVNIKS